MSTETTPSYDRRALWELRLIAGIPEPPPPTDEERRAAREWVDDLIRGHDEWLIRKYGYSPWQTS